MIENSSLVTSISSTSSPHLCIGDVCSCPVHGYGMTQPTPHLPSCEILNVPIFIINILSISVIIHSLHCSISTFSFHRAFWDLLFGPHIGLRCENGYYVYNLWWVKIERGIREEIGKRAVRGREKEREGKMKEATIEKMWERGRER